tara:strand:- start:367 stop:1350 length:984 start_codon:yes stop_codon:yes gene_type:complete
MKLYTRMPLFFLFIFFINHIEAEVYKIGFGSCIDQDLPQPIWEPIEKEKVNTFIFLGDNVYGDDDSGNLSKLKSAYKKQKKLLPEWLTNNNIFSIWDDHDYGLNDGGSSFNLKNESQKLYLDFWDIPKNDERRSRKGVYFSKIIELENFKINLIGLDTRYFRSDLLGTKLFYKKDNSDSSTILGDAQWKWLKNVIKTDSDLIILMSSIQVLATEHRFEKWNLFPKEREKLIALIDSSNIPLIIISGDRHRGALYELDDIYELTSSSLNKPVAISKLVKENDKLMIGKTYNEENYGVIEINTDQAKVSLSLKNKSGEIINTVSIKIKN